MSDKLIAGQTLIENIRISHQNPRQSFDVDALNELAESIKAHGIIEPLVVRPIEEGHGTIWELVAGERRLRAAQQLGMTHVPCVIRPMDDRTAKEVRLLENLQRQDLTPLEEASAIKELLADGGTQAELAKKLGKSQTWISQRLKLLALPEQALALVVSGDITPKHALVLVPLADYPAIIEGVVANLSETIDNGDTVTVDGMDEIIGASLDDMEWDPVDDPDIKEGLVFPVQPQFGDHRLRHLTPYLDLEPCDKCPRTISFLYYGNEVTDCLDLPCLNKKLDQAKLDFAEFQKQQAKELGVKGVIDPNQLRIDGISDYRTLRSYMPEFDQSVCEKCDKRRQDSRLPDNFICLDPACYDKHKKEKKSAELQEAKDAWSKTLIALDKATLPKQGGTLTEPTTWQKRSLLQSMGKDWEYKDAVDRATKAFGCNHGNLHEVLQDDDLDCVLSRILIMRTVCDKVRYGGRPSAAMVEEAIKFAMEPPPKTEKQKAKDAEEAAEDYADDVPDCYGDGDSCCDECVIVCQYYEDCKAEIDGGDD